MDIALRLLLAIPLAMFLGWFVVFVFSLITGITNLVVLGIAKAIRSVLRLLRLQLTSRGDRDGGH